MSSREGFFARFRREALENPVVLRESGLDYCKREMGMNPGRGKLVFTGILLGIVIFTPIILGTIHNARMPTLALTVMITLPVMIGAALIDAPRAFAGGTDRAYTEDLLLTPLGIRSIAAGKVFARGLPVLLYALVIGAIGVGVFTYYLAQLLSLANQNGFNGDVSSKTGLALFGLVLSASGPFLVRIYIEGLRAGLAQRHVFLRLLGRVLKYAAIVLLMAALAAGYLLVLRGSETFVSVRKISRAGELVTWRLGFRMGIVALLVAMLWRGCWKAYQDLVTKLEEELHRRMGLLE